MSDMTFEDMIADIVNLERCLLNQKITKNFGYDEISDLEKKYRELYSINPEYYAVLIRHIRGWCEYYEKYEEDI